MIIEGRLVNGQITNIETEKSYPWLETIKGGNWLQTKIPKNPFEITSTHAEKVINIIKDMELKLKEFMPYQITDEWLNRIKFKNKKTGKVEHTSTEALWGGYTPNDD